MKILVVEDQESIRRMIEALVKARGHEVSTANSGAKALECVQAELPDLVLLDLTMPGAFDGIEVCRRLRQDPDTRHLPILIITAVTEPSVREEAMRAGATAFFEKPFSPIALLKEIDAFGP